MTPKTTDATTGVVVRSIEKLGSARWRSACSACVIEIVSEVDRVVLEDFMISTTTALPTWNTTT
jgi:hypothetical protein